MLIAPFRIEREASPLLSLDTPSGYLKIKFRKKRASLTISISRLNRDSVIKERQRDNRENFTFRTNIRGLENDDY